MSRFLRVVPLVVLAGVLSQCATATGAGGVPPEGAVALRFAWPEGLTVQVASTNSVTQNQQPPEQSSLSYQLRLEGKGDERRLVTEQMTPTGASAQEEEGSPPPTPTLVLGPKGELLRIEGIDPIIQEMAKEAESQGLPKEQQEHITGLVRDALERATRSRWEMLVGKWKGLVLKPGEGVDRKSQTTVPLFGSTANTLEHVTLKERVPCVEGAAEKRCVRLSLESTLDPAGMPQATDELLRKVKSYMKANMGLADVAIPDMKVEKLRLDSTVDFIVEPETLVPHKQSIVTNANIVLREADTEAGAGEEPKSFDIHSERVETFTPGAR